MLEQQSVNVGARQQSLQMEINVCRERVQQFEKSLQAKKSAIEKCKKELDSLTFNPSRKLHDSSNTDERPGRKAAVKRKLDASSSTCIGEERTGKGSALLFYIPTAGRPFCQLII